MADQSGKPTETVFDVTQLLEWLERIAAENAPIHSAISALNIPAQKQTEASPCDTYLAGLGKRSRDKQ